MRSTTRRTVFISGSAYEYGRFGDSGRPFIRNLSRALLNSNFKIITGFGLGVGNHVLDATLEVVYSEKRAPIVDHLMVFPFPGPGHTESIKTTYRSDLIGHAEIAIFLFGNKLEDIAVKEADGMEEEFEIARSQQATLIPVGACGYTSEKLWRKMMDNYDNHCADPGKYELYQKLGDNSISNVHLIDTILQIAG